jgi:cell division protein FtsB
MGMMERVLLGVACSLMVVLALLIVFSEKGLRDRMVLERELRQIRRDITIIEEENREIVRRIGRLKHDAAYIEHLARHGLEMAARQEYVFRVRETPKGKDADE